MTSSLKRPSTRRLLSQVIAGLFLVLPLVLQAEVVVRAADYGLSIASDATPAIRAAVQAVQSLHAQKLLLPKGRFRLGPDGAVEKYCVLSNHDSGSRRIAFYLHDLENLTIAGDDTELVFHGRMIPFRLERVKGLTLRGVTIDWEVPFNFQGTVVSVDASNDSFDLRVLPELHTRIRRGELVHFYDTGDPTTSWEQNLYWTAWFQGLRLPMVPTSTPTHTAPHSIDLAAGKGKPAAEVESLGGGRYRLRHAVHQLPHVGWVMVAKGDKEARRTSPAIYAVECTDVMINHVTVHHAGGMGFMAERCTDVRLDHFDVRLPPGSNRVVSTTADATHFFHCRGDIVITGCRFENMLDDGTNVHGNYLAVVRRIDAQTLLARIGHDQEYGSLFADPGDEISFAPLRTLLPFHHQKLAAIENLNALECVLHFAEPLPEKIGPDTVLDNLSWQPNVRIDHTVIRNNRARSILIKTRGDVVIEDCELLNPSSMSILASSSANRFWEAGPTDHIEIRHNLIRTINPDVPVFSFHPIGTDVAASHGAFNRNITIEDNRIETAGGRVVEAWLTENLVVSRNRISVTDPAAAGSRQAFQLRKVTGVRIVDNQATAARSLQVSADKVSRDVVVARNTGIAQGE